MTQRDRGRLVLLKKAQKKLTTHRGLTSLMRRHRHNISPEQYQRLAEYLQQRPALESISRFKQRLTYLLLEKGRNQRRRRKLARLITQ